MRATNPRGTSRGKPVAAAGPSAAGVSSKSLASSLGSRRASCSAACHDGRVSAAALSAGVPLRVELKTQLPRVVRVPGAFGGMMPRSFSEQDTSMAVYSTNEFKNGLKILLDGDPYAILENEYVKPGKGQAINRVKVRNLKAGRVVEKTFKSGDTAEGADVVDQDMQYLYTDGQFWYFMVPDTFEQVAAGEAAVADAKDWIKEQSSCIVTLWNGVPLYVAP